MLLANSGNNNGRLHLGTKMMNVAAHIWGDSTI